MIGVAVLMALKFLRPGIHGKGAMLVFWVIIGVIGIYAAYARSELFTWIYCVLLFLLSVQVVFLVLEFSDILFILPQPDPEKELVRNG